MKKKYFLMNIFFLLALIPSLLAAKSSSNDQYLGKWAGGMTFLSGESSPASFYFFEKDNRLQVKFDLPGYNAFDLVVEEMSFDGSQIELRRTNSSGELTRYRGDIQNGVILGGFFVGEEKRGIFQLIRNNERLFKHLEIPDFEAPLLENESTVNKTSFANKYVILDFWTTGCGPCIAEMPNMHEIYKKFKSENFEILSLSLDRSAELVQRFREKRWPMPWLNAHIGPRHEMLRSMNITQTPTILLISPDGTIVAKDGELRAENLEKTLVRYLGEPGVN